MGGYKLNTPLFLGIKATLNHEPLRRWLTPKKYRRQWQTILNGQYNIAGKSECKFICRRETGQYSFRAKTSSSVLALRDGTLRTKYIEIK